MFQRPHERSTRAVRKDYQLVSRPLPSDLTPVLDELKKQPLEWLDSQWKWHIESHFSILRAGERQRYPGSELTHGHSINQQNLTNLPLLRAFIDSAFPVRPTVAWLGRLPQAGRIYLHVDNTRHWDEHHRVHVPLITNSEARLCVAERFLHLSPGRSWLINNSVPHGAVNRGPDRLHLVLDLPGFAGFEAWLSEGTAEPGEADGAALAELSRDPLRVSAAANTLDMGRLTRMRAQ